MRVYERNGHWRLEGMVNGKRYHRAIPEAINEKMAKEYMNCFVADLLRGRLELAENIGQKPFVKIADDYIEYAETNLASFATVIKIANRFKDCWKNKQIKGITPALIEKYKKMRKETVYYSKIVDGKEITKIISPETVNRELGVLRKIFSMAIANKLAKENPLYHVKNLKVPNKQPRFLSVQEEERIMKVCDGDFSFLDITLEEQEHLRKKYHKHHMKLKPIVMMALLTGMRKSEILNMKWENVDFDAKEITAVNTKNGTSNTLPLSEKFYELLLQMRKEQPNAEYIFTNPETNTRYKDLKRSFSSILRLAGVENFRFHDQRHTCATRLVKLGYPLPVVQSILNHKRIQSTMRYSHPMVEQKKDALEALSHYAG